MSIHHGTGMIISKSYCEKVGLPTLLLHFPELEGHFAAGRVGEGSECFGFDDELSFDHDFGAGFCIWLDEQYWERYGSVLNEAYWKLPADFSGFLRPESGPFYERVGVFSINNFYSRFIGKNVFPESIFDWFSLPQEMLALCTNGSVFLDSPGDFSKIRNHLLGYYPEAVRLKKLAAHCALAAQAGQYNYSRCIARNEHSAAIWALSKFLCNYMSAAFLINRRYMPYGKWAPRAFGMLPILGAETHPILEMLSPDNPDTPVLIEKLCTSMADILRAQGLSSVSGNYLLSHGESIQQHVENPYLSSLPVMAWKTGWQV